MDLLSAIRDFIELHGKDPKYKAAVESLDGVLGKLKEVNPHTRQVTTPGKLAARLAALGEEAESPAEEAKETPAQEAKEPAEAPKTFADAKAAALDMVSR